MTPDAKNDRLSMLKLVHDLKSPLTAVKILQARDNFGHHEERLLRAAIANLESLLANLVGETSPSDHTKSVETEALCFALAQEKCLLSDVNIDLVWEAGQFRLPIDLIELRRALANLLDNAVRAALCTGGTVRLRIWQDMGSVIFDVIDTGSGMCSKELEKLSREPADSRTGWGVGLMIVREIVEKCGGLLHFSSTKGEGTWARIRLPRA